MRWESAVVAAALAQNAAAVPFAEPGWPGWEGLKNLFVFGDSYTATGFNISLAQPSDANPLGNPDFPGLTTANGPNWVDFITTTYNRSKLYAYDFAYKGATVDSALVKQYRDDVQSLKDQVNKLFLPNYSPPPSATPWTSNDSLFTFWFGINDVGKTYFKPNITGLYNQIAVEYRRNLDLLYGSGARNFLFMLVPPIQRSPVTLAKSTNATEEAAIVEQEMEGIMSFNTHINSVADSLSRDYNDTTIFVFDSYTLFDNILNDVTMYPQTSNLKDTTTYCNAYANGTSRWDTFYQNCSYPVNQYFWLDNLHPTYPVHKAIADQVVKLIEAPQDEECDE